jgi:N,N'-diacetyllegionaminate synthase
MGGVLVIAEAGVNHNGSLDIARQLIDVAAECGADIVKFQTFVADEMVTSDAQTAKYQQLGSAGALTQYEMLKNLELTYSDHLELVLHCQERNISFLSTAFDTSSVDLLIKLDQQMFKIPSGEITNTPYLRYIAKLGYPIILSTGMANLSEIEFAIETIEKAGTQRNDITLMHCTSAYPAPMDELNLSAILTLKEFFNLEIGYSDHSLGIEASIAAVALGATVIEKHFTLSNDLPGPDHVASLEPSELEALIKGIRKIEGAMGSGVKGIANCELENINVVRKSIVASCPINRGEQLTESNLTTKRPGIGISPTLWDEIVGSVATQDYCENDLIAQ